MPLWQIFHPEGTFAIPEAKQALATDITTIYTTSGLPAFYVVVNFIPQPAQNTYVGGQNPTRPFIRLVADHIAVHLKEDETRVSRMTARVDTVLKPHIADK